MDRLKHDNEKRRPLMRVFFLQQPTLKTKLPLSSSMAIITKALIHKSLSRETVGPGIKGNVY